jgi:hypothetical protein
LTVKIVKLTKKLPAWSAAARDASHASASPAVIPPA